MPYITKRRREALAHRAQAQNAGELTYVLTVILEWYREDRGTNFQTFAEIIGALEQAKDEFQRRVIHPYENAKLEANGDVYAPGV